MKYNKNWLTFGLFINNSIFTNEDLRLEYTYPTRKSFFIKIKKDKKYILSNTGGRGRTGTPSTGTGF